MQQKKVSTKNEINSDSVHVYISKQTIADYFGTLEKWDQITQKLEPQNLKLRLMTPFSPKCLIKNVF